MGGESFGWFHGRNSCNNNLLYTFYGAQITRRKAVIGRQATKMLFCGVRQERAQRQAVLRTLTGLDSGKRAVRSSPPQAGLSERSASWSFGTVGQRLIGGQRTGSKVTPRGAASGAITSNAKPLHLKQRSKTSKASSASVAAQ